MKRMKKIIGSKKYQYLLLLHLLLAVYSMSGIASKYAAQQEWMSVSFCVLYGIVVLVLCLYAVFWQQVIRKLPLITAYANKAVTVVWGIVWGVLFFDEPLNYMKAAGAAVIVIGVYMVVLSEERR